MALGTHSTGVTCLLPMFQKAGAPSTIRKPSLAPDCELLWVQLGPSGDQGAGPGREKVTPTLTGDSPSLAQPKTLHPPQRALHPPQPGLGGWSLSRTLGLSREQILHARVFSPPGEQCRPVPACLGLTPGCPGHSPGCGGLGRFSVVPTPGHPLGRSQTQPVQADPAEAPGSEETPLPAP